MKNDDVIDLREVFAILRRQSRLFLVSFALIFSLALLYTFTATPLYQSSALIYVDPSNKDLLASEETRGLSANAENARVESEIQILRSNRVVLETLQRTGLITDDEFGPSLGRIDKLKLALGIEVDTNNDPQKIVQSVSAKLRNATAVKRQGLTYIIKVSAKSADPEKAAEIANSMSKAYIDLQIAAKVDAVLASRDVLQNQIDSAREQLTLSETSFDNYVIENLDTLGQDVNSPAFDNLKTEFQELVFSSNSIEEQIDSAQSALTAQNWNAVLAQLGDEAVRSLDTQRRILVNRLDGVRAGSDEEVDLRAGLLNIESLLQEEAERAIGTLQTQLATQEDAVGDLRRSIRLEVANGDLSPQTLTSIFALQQEADIAQRQYTTLLSRMRDLEARATVQVADSRIVSDAIPPRLPSEPDNKLILVVGAILALGLGTALAFLNEFFVGGVVSTSQLRNIIPVKIAGAVPKSTVSTQQLSAADLITDEPLSSYSESVRRVRAIIDQTMSDKKDKCKVIMVTSAVSSEGKSTLSLSLARTYAEAGKNVLLIDADLRKPTQHKLIGYEPDEGFLEYLSAPDKSGQADRGFYVSDPKSQAGIVLGRGQAELPTDQLLQSDAFEKILASSRETMDVVIIDTPPIVPVVDARYIIPMVDSVVISVRYRLTSQSVIRDAFEEVVSAQTVEVPVFTVFNMDEGKTMDRGYYSY